MAYVSGKPSFDTFFAAAGKVRYVLYFLVEMLLSDISPAFQFSDWPAIRWVEPFLYVITYTLQWEENRIWNIFQGDLIANIPFEL